MRTWCNGGKKILWKNHANDLHKKLQVYNCVANDVSDSSVREREHPASSFEHRLDPKPQTSCVLHQCSCSHLPVLSIVLSVPILLHQECVPKEKNTSSCSRAFRFRVKKHASLPSDLSGKCTACGWWHCAGASCFRDTGETLWAFITVGLLSFPSMSGGRSVHRLWRPAAQRQVRNAWAMLHAHRSAWTTSSVALVSSATALVNASLSLRF